MFLFLAQALIAYGNGPDPGEGSAFGFLEMEAGPKQLLGGGGRLTWSFSLHWCSIDTPRMNVRDWGDDPNLTLHFRLFGHRSVRGLSSHFQSNIPESLDIGVSAQVWLLSVGMVRCGRGESWELVCSHAVRGVAGSASSLLSSWIPQAAAL